VHARVQIYFTDDSNVEQYNTFHYDTEKIRTEINSNIFDDSVLLEWTGVNGSAHTSPDNLF